jgi:tRNA(fMet)-specific endonuclease VapC
MSQYLLDTNICVHFLKNEHYIAQHIAAVGFSNCYLSELTIAELLFGVANSAPTRQADNRKAVEELQETFAERVLLIGPGLEHYAQQKALLRKMGRPVDDMDLLIGVTAVAHGLTLVTRNTRHFIAIQGIVLQNWVDQPISPLPAG